MDLTDFRVAVAAELGLDNSAASADQVQIDGWLNMGVRDILLRTHCYVVRGETPIVEGEGDYTLDSDILAIIDINGPSSGSFGPMGSEDMFELRRRSHDHGGDVRSYAILGSNLLLVHPTPSGEELLTIYYVPKPTEMSSGTHDPSSPTYGGIPVEFHPAIELYAFMRGSSYDDDDGRKHGEEYRQLYETFLVKTIRPAVNRKGGSRMPRARVGHFDYPRHRNDVY